MALVGIYPGSFNPWHEGHEDVLRKALKIFGQVIIAVGYNPSKPESDSFEHLKKIHNAKNKRIQVVKFEGLIADFIRKESQLNIQAVIRGLRNGQDFEYEKTQQYWNEDLGVEIPVIYFICDRKLSHISSSAIRSVERFQK